MTLAAEVLRRIRRYPIRTPIGWIGNKTSILPILYAAFPLHYDRYIEPFGGSAAVLLGKPKPDRFEVYNDYNRNLVNLFQCMRDRPAAMIQELGFLPLNAREEFDACRRFFAREVFTDDFRADEERRVRELLPPPQADEILELQTRLLGDHDLRRAALFFREVRYSYSSGGRAFACQPFDIQSTFGLIWSLSRRLKDTIIENQDFERLIKHYDRENSFFYCDPPYLFSEHMYDAPFSLEHHLRLRDTLMNIKGKFLLSYNDCEEIRKLYEGCDMIGFTRPHPMTNRVEVKDGEKREFPELLVANYDIYERERNKPLQISLLDVLNEPQPEVLEMTEKESIYDESATGNLLSQPAFPAAGGSQDDAH